MRAALAVVLALVVAPAWAQVVPEREVDVARQLYEVGKFAEALRRARDAMGLTNFTDDQRLRLHEVAALSAFNLGDPGAAQQHFLQLLQLNPDHQLDPFAVAPPAIRLFEQVRRDNTDALNLVRQQLALRAEQERREETERERRRVEDEERRRRAEAQAQLVTVRTVEKHPLLLNLLPFGAGQFLQGRVAWGVTFAVSEAVLALTSVIAYLAIDSLYETRSQTIDGRLEPASVPLRALPPDRLTEYRVWSALKYATGAAFYAAWAAGVGEALWHHQPQTVTETRERIAPSARLDLSPTRGGLGATFTVSF